MHHPNKCEHCSEVFQSQESINNHILSKHTYNCYECGFTGTGEEAMEDHILDMHAKPDSNNLFKCADCAFWSENKKDFGKHYKHNHGSLSAKTNPDEINHLKEELRQTKSNFNRLESVYNEVLKDAEEAKSEFEVKIMNFNDNLTRISRENEALKERNEILYKLGKGYLEATQNQTNSTSMEQSTSIPVNKTVINGASNSNDEDIEVVDCDPPTNNPWTSHRLRGFKRTNHAPSVNQSKTSQTNLQTVEAPTESAENSTQHEPHPIPQGSNLSGQKKYCQYFVNFGRCEFEEKSKMKCKFSHERAPMCNAGLSCSRIKCMYSHPKLPISQTIQRNFLGNPVNFGQFVNPRQHRGSMNQWSNQSIPIWQNQYQNN